MKSLSEYTLDESFGLLIEGPPKTGKTTLALQFEAPFILDCSNNLSGAIRVLQKIPGYDISKVKFARPWLYDNGDVRPMENRWMAMLEQLNAAFRDKSIRTIIVDDIAVVSDWLIAFIVAEKPAGKKEGMTISDWTPYRALLSKMVTDARLICRDQRYFIVTAHEEYAKDERLGTIYTRVNIPSKLADNFGGLFSDVWRTEVEDGDPPKYIVRSQPSAAVPAIGNSLGLQKTFRFDWSTFQKYLKGTK